jgi:hypothetical protein
MKADVRRRIEEALARTRGEPVNSSIHDLRQAVKQGMSGEREFSIEEKHFPIQE